MLWGTLCWILHFILEFMVVIQTGSPLIFISFHFIGIIIGGFLAVKSVSKWNHFISFIGLSGLQVFWYIALLLNTQVWFVPIGLLGGGLCIGMIWGLFTEQFVFTMEDPKFGGRMFGLGIFASAPLIIIQGFISFNTWINISYFLALFLMLAAFLVIGKSDHKIPPQEQLDLGRFLKTKENLPKLALGIFFGFFFTNTYYATFLIVEDAGFQAQFNTFVIILWATVAIFTLISGVLIDRFGRRIIILIGLCIQSLAFLLLSFVAKSEFMLIFIIPIILGTGFIMCLSGTLCFFVEDPPRQYIRDSNYIYFSFMGIGMLCGVLLGELMRPVILFDPVYLTITLLFIFVIATLIISQIKDTLPAREELEWKDTIRDFFCILSDKGICVYRHPFKREIEIEENLFAGGISGITTMIQEMVKSDKKTKIIDQEDVKLLFEMDTDITCVLISGKNLKILRQKLQSITHEIELLFKEVFPIWEGNLDIFLPIGSLVKKYFSEK
ncbi:MAG: MFS transporter [Candidatus Helarchaeota archaeon]|nr:MFS transporter [Candidatus Helarchaeota archaeon]